MLTTITTIFAIPVFALTFWLGSYLVSRSSSNRMLILAAYALIIYSLAIVCTILNSYTSPTATFPLAVIYLAFSCTSLLLFLLANGSSQSISYPSTRSSSTKMPRNVPRIHPIPAILFITGSAIILFHPVFWSTMSGPVSSFISGLAGLCFLPFGLNLAFLDAADRGETLLPDLFRSFDYSFCIAFIFGSQVAFVIIIFTGPTLPMLTLLLAVIASSILLQTFSDQVMVLLDKLAFSRLPQMQKARAELRTAASALPRVNSDLDLEHMDEAEFVRLTRRALSSFGNLSHLAASPLTNLPEVDIRIAQNGHKDDALGRAIALKELLSESICRLKPQNKGDFGTSDEWRYYNALYFPYIAGLKPYSRRNYTTPTDPTTKAALNWFRTQIPERTLYNWQTAATRLIAQDLRGTSTSKTQLPV